MVHHKASITGVDHQDHSMCDHNRLRLTIYHLTMLTIVDRYRSLFDFMCSNHCMIDRLTIYQLRLTVGCAISVIHIMR